MHTYWLMPFVLAAVPSVLAVPSASHWGDMRVKHSWGAVPENWESLGHPLAGTTINLRIALKSHRENALIDTLHEVSSPDHPRYGAHLSREQVAELVAPHPDTLGLIKSWLKHYGVPSSSFSVTHHGNWLKVASLNVSQANELLGASYQLYRHTETNDTVLRTISYALPAALEFHVKTVAPTTYFGSPGTLTNVQRMPPGDTAVALEDFGKMPSSRSEYGLVSPSYLRQLYNLETYVPKATYQNLLAIAGYNQQYPSRADLLEFMQEFSTSGTNADYGVVSVNGGLYFPGLPGLEASVCVQYTQGMTYPTRQVFYSTAGQGPLNRDSGTPVIPGTDTPINTNAPFLDWLDYVLARQYVPPTISTSFSENEQTVPEDYARSVCDSFAELGVRGASVITSTGNYGVGMGDCKVNDGDDDDDDDDDGDDADSGKVQFLPRFPSSCPWVTSVGGTSGYPEVAAPFSSGGFSNYFQIPYYQYGAVSTYIRNLDGLHDGLFNASSRGFPDIAAQASNFKVYVGGKSSYAHGTSCATPVVAGIISLLNDFRLSQNKATLGFINPWLYGYGMGGLNDITSGWNPGCGTNGFPATSGWDPITGLGTPDFGKLRDILVALPYPGPDSYSCRQPRNCTIGV